MLRLVLAPALVLLLAAAATPAQPPRDQKGPGKEAKGKAKAEKKAPTTRELFRWLEEPLDVAPYQSAMSLKEALDRFTKAFAAKGKALPLLVDSDAFKEANPDAEDLYDTPVKFPPVPRRMKFETALRFTLSRIGTGNGTFLVRRGCIEITTLERGGPAQLLEERVTAAFHKRPLAEALEELADLTGATIILDPRVGEKAETPITARFRNTISLEGAVRLLAEMAGLQARVGEESVLFVTARPKKGRRPRQADLSFRGRPFDLALRELADWSGTSIILDPRAEQEPIRPWFGPGTGIHAPPEFRAKTRVVATFKVRTSGRAAACILARMVGLEAIPIDNAVFVTTRQIAQEMRGQTPSKPLAKVPPPK
jgi:hypothetical protein